MERRCEASDLRSRQCGRIGTRLDKHLGWLCKDHDPEQLSPPFGKLCQVDGCEAPAEHYESAFGLWYCAEHAVDEWRGGCTAMVRTLYPCARMGIASHEVHYDSGDDVSWLCERHLWQYSQAAPKRELILLDWRRLGYPEMLDSSDGSEPLEAPLGIDGVVDFERTDEEGRLTRYVLSQDTARMWEIRYDAKGNPVCVRMSREGSDATLTVSWGEFGIDARMAGEKDDGVNGYVSCEDADPDGTSLLMVYSQQTGHLWEAHLDTEGQVDRVVAGPEDLYAEEV